MVNILVSRLIFPAFKFQLHFQLYNWNKLLNVPEPSFLICAVGVIKVPTSQADEIEWYYACKVFQTPPGTQRFYLTYEHHPHQILIVLGTVPTASYIDKCSFFFFSFFFLGLHPWHMEISGLGVKKELQLLAYTTATWDPSCIYNLHCGLQQRGILNPRREARDQTHILMGTSQMLKPSEPHWELRINVPSHYIFL